MPVYCSLCGYEPKYNEFVVNVLMYNGDSEYRCLYCLMQAFQQRLPYIFTKKDSDYYDNIQEQK